MLILPTGFQEPGPITLDDRESNYVFLYDQDGHYSKIKIVSFGGTGTLGDPAWVKVQWYYNNTALDNRF
jgi:hypothetical protein